MMPRGGAAGPPGRRTAGARGRPRAAAVRKAAPGAPDLGARASRLRVAIVLSRYNDFATGPMRDAAVAALTGAGVPRGRITLHEVPGAYEIPQAAARIAERLAPHAIVCLGCVIRGETPHFEYISSAVAHGLTAAAIATGVPMAFGVLTTNSVEEARARSAPGDGNKGREAALAALAMAKLFGELGA